MSVRSFVEKKLKYFEKKFVAYNNIYISKQAILHNFDHLSTLSDKKHIIPVLKSNAYGHGMEEISTILKARSFPYLAIDGYFEGLRIHDITSQPVLVMGAINPKNFKNMKFRGFAFVVHDEKTVTALGETGKKVPLHIELETGMGRHGVRLDELSNFLKHIKQYPNLYLEGVMTHLADADNPQNSQHVTAQTNKFDAGVKMTLEAGFKPLYIHIAQSAGSIKAKSKYANTLRVGLALYGITPLEITDPFAAAFENLEPALTLTTTIGKELRVTSGDSISYGCTFVAKRDSRIGILPFGYYEGLPRSLSSNGHVQYKSEDVPIVGRVCMNHTMVDITDSEATYGDVVTIISPKKDDGASISNICLKHKLFNYSFLVGLNQTIRRTIVE